MSEEDNNAEMNEEEGEEQFDDEDMEEDDALDEKIAALQSTLEASPNDYDSRLELIHLLRKNGDLDALRKERRNMSERFTMFPDFWMDWIADEKQFGGEKEEIKRLFKQACKDFHSPKVYLEYAQWACGISIPFAQEIMEEAVSKIGLRCDCAFLIWSSYIDLEKMILNSMKGEAIAEQKNRILGLYARMLRIPYLDMADSWNDYCAFIETAPDAALKNDYEKAFKLLPELEEFENLLKKESITVEEELAILSDYVEFEKKGGDPARIQMAYERALVTSASTPNANLWLEYGSWLDFELKIPAVAANAYSRAVRHSPCAALWQQYFTALERANMVDVIDRKWVNALESVVTAEEGFALYRTHIYSLRRRALKEAETRGDSVDYEKVLAAFDEGTDFLKNKFGNFWDSPKAQFRKNHAHFLYIEGKQPDKARKIWNDILASGSGHMASAWIEAANLERYFGSVNNARKLLYRAINSASDHPHMAFDALIQFERETGTLEELDKSLMKVNAQAARIAARPQTKKEKESGKKEKKSGSDFHDNKTVSFDSSGDVKGATKRISSEERGKALSGNNHPALKRAKVVDKDGFAVPQLPDSKEQFKPTNGEASKEGPSGSAQTVFISNLDFKLPKEKIMEVFPEAKDVRLVYRGMSKLHKGFGYVDFEDSTDAVKALNKDRMLIEGRPMYVSEYKPHDKGERSEFRYPTGLEKNKVFVNNVHYDATAEQLKEVFGGFGVVKDVRIVTHKSGKSKGCAYVEFEDENGANAAIKAKDIILLDRKLAVALSNPPKRQEQSTVKSSTILVRHRNKVDLVPRIVSQTKHSTVAASKANSARTNDNGKTAETLVSDKPAIGNSGGKMSNEQFRKFL